jgi:hypothetical protein
MKLLLATILTVVPMAAGPISLKVTQGTRTAGSAASLAAVDGDVLTIDAPGQIAALRADYGQQSEALTLRRYVWETGAPNGVACVAHFKSNGQPVGVGNPKFNVGEGSRFEILETLSAPTAGDVTLKLRCLSRASAFTLYLDEFALEPR